MTETAIDLDAYFARIGYSGPRAPTPEVLTALHRHHLHAIPFENIDVQLKRPIRLDPDSLQRKLVTNRRGGYCFESNGLFFHVLRALGFNNTALAARVLFERPEDAPLPPRTHMLQRVDFDDGALLVDVAFGGQSPAAPLRLATDAAQPTPRESCRLVERDGDLVLQWQAGGEWRPLYRIVLQPQQPVDFEPANWLTSTHPASRFTNNLVGALPAEGRRYTLFNREFRTRYTDGRLETRALEKADELLDVLGDRFGLALTAEDRSGLTDLFPRLPSAA